MTIKEGQVTPLYHDKVIFEIQDGMWALYRRRGDHLEPVGVRGSKAEAEGWLGYSLPVAEA